MIGYIIYQVVL